MPIVYALISREKTVLAEHAIATGKLFKRGEKTVTAMSLFHQEIINLL